MSANADATLYVDVEARAAIRELQKLVREGKKTGDTFDRTDKSSKKMATGFKGLAKSVGALAGVGGAMYGLQAVLRSSTQAALGFSAAMGEVSTLLPSATDMRAVSDEVRRLSVEFGQSNVEQAKAMYQVISAGAADAAEASQILTVANRLAVGGVTDVATAADGLTSVLNAYGMAAGDASAVSDALFVGMKAGKTTIGEMSAALGRVAPLAATVGIEFDELVAATAALTKGGISTKESITGLRAIMAAVVKPTSEAVEMAKALEIQFNATALQTQGLAGFMDTLVQATGGSADKLAQLFGGVEALVPAMALAGQAGADLNTILGSMETKAGATGEAFDKVAGTDAYRLNKALNELKDASVDLGNAVLVGLVPAMELVAASIRDVVPAAQLAWGVMVGDAGMVVKAIREMAAEEEKATDVSRDRHAEIRRLSKSQLELAEAVLLAKDRTAEESVLLLEIHDRLEALNQTTDTVNDSLRDQADAAKEAAEAWKKFLDQLERAESLAFWSGRGREGRRLLDPNQLLKDPSTLGTGQVTANLDIGAGQQAYLDAMARADWALENLGETAEGIEPSALAGAHGLLSITDSLGILDNETRRVAQSIISAVSGFGAGGLGGTLGIVGGVFGAVSVLSSILASRGPQENPEVERLNRERISALERNTRALERMADDALVMNANAARDAASNIEKAIKNITAKREKERELAADPENRLDHEALVRLKVDWENIDLAAKKFGITIRDQYDKIIPGALRQLLEATDEFLESLAEMQEEFQKDLEYRRLRALGLDDEADAYLRARRQQEEWEQALEAGYDDATLWTLRYIHSLENSTIAMEEARRAREEEMQVVYALIDAISQFDSLLNIPVTRMDLWTNPDTGESEYVPWGVTPKKRDGQWGYYDPRTMEWTPIGQEEEPGATDVSRRERSRRNTDMSSWTRGMSDVTGQHMAAIQMSQLAFLQAITVNTARTAAALSGSAYGVNALLGESVTEAEHSSGKSFV